MFKNRLDVHFSQDTGELTPLGNQTKKSSLKNRKGNSTAVVFILCRRNRNTIILKLNGNQKRLQLLASTLLSANKFLDAP